MNIKSRPIKVLEMIMEAFPADGISIEQLELRMKELGNKVIERRTKSLVVGYARKDFVTGEEHDTPHR